MANVFSPQPTHIDFQPHPVHHAPSPFGFGFGLSSSSSAFTHPLQHVNSLPLQQTTSRPAKRRLEVEDPAPVKSKRSEDAMDRSPTPERPKRAPPKRARINPSQQPEDRTGKENKPPTSGESDVDFGVLLASLPSQSLLPILTSLLEAHPQLKSSVLPLIPRPTLETAIEALNRSAKKLRDAYPYSTTPSFANQSFASTSFGARPSISPGLGFGFGRQNNVPQSSFGHNQASGGMRDTYITSRLDPHINEFVAACMSYLPYFSFVNDASAPSLSSSTPSHSSALQTLHKEKSHPSETYTFLAALTNHFFSQPPLTQKSLASSLGPRLLLEWKAWVDKVDEVVNRKGGMFGSETVRSWEAGLDHFAQQKDPDGVFVMTDIRNSWVTRVGWLVGRTVQYAMDEL